MNKEANEEVREPEVRNLLEQLERSVNIHDELNTRLIDRLSDAVRPSEPSEEETKEVTRKPVTSLGNIIYGIFERVDGLNQDMESLLERLEI